MHYVQGVCIPDKSLVVHQEIRFEAGADSLTKLCLDLIDGGHLRTLGREGAGHPL